MDDSWNAWLDVDHASRLLLHKEVAGLLAEPADALLEVERLLEVEVEVGMAISFPSKIWFSILIDCKLLLPSGLIWLRNSTIYLSSSSLERRVL